MFRALSQTRRSGVHKRGNLLTLAKGPIKWKPSPIEIKGNELTAPRNASSTRYQAFLKGVLSFISKHSGVCFAVSFLKNSADPTAPTSLYTHALQILVERLSTFITEHSHYENATLICDSRARGLSGEQNLEVIKSHMSYIFGHCTGRICTNILEAPLFADSRFCVGVQLADIFASVCFSNHYHYYLASKDSDGTAGYFDYSHMPKYWPVAKSIIWRGQGRVRGFPRYGMRVVDYRRTTQSSKTRAGP